MTAVAVSAADSFWNSVSGGFGKLLDAGFDRAVNEINPHVKALEPKAVQSLSDQQPKTPTTMPKQTVQDMAPTTVVAQPVPAQPMPKWVMPAAVAGGALVLALLISR